MDTQFVSFILTVYETYLNHLKSAGIRVLVIFLLLVES